MQKQWASAETHLKQAKSLNKTPRAEIHWQLALLYNQIGRYAEAANELESFLKVQPDSRDAEQLRKLIGELHKKK
ncbi:MAG: tetratricopeptide repeat protein [Pyrinomonadaceae bacterium]